MTVQTQEKVSAIAASFNRCLRQTRNAPLSVERIVMLRQTRGLLEQLKASDIFDFDNLPAVEAALSGIESECREAGLFETFANMPRAQRRRLQKITGDDQ